MKSTELVVGKWYSVDYGRIGYLEEKNVTKGWHRFKVLRYSVPFHINSYLEGNFFDSATVSSKGICSEVLPVDLEPPPLIKDQVTRLLLERSQKEYEDELRLRDYQLKYEMLKAEGLKIRTWSVHRYNEVGDRFREDLRYLDRPELDIVPDCKETREALIAHLLLFKKPEVTIESH